MLSSEISRCLAEAVCFMLVKCVGCGAQGFGDIEVVARGGFARLSSRQPLFYSQIFHALSSYYLTTAAFIDTHSNAPSCPCHRGSSAKGLHGDRVVTVFPIILYTHTDNPKWKSKVVCVCMCVCATATRKSAAPLRIPTGRPHHSDH